MNRFYTEYFEKENSDYHHHFNHQFFHFFGNTFSIQSQKSLRQRRS